MISKISNNARHNKIFNYFYAIFWLVPLFCITLQKSNQTDMETKYKRILLKLSGESLAAGTGHGIDTDRLNAYAQQIKAVVDAGVQVSIVIGGGNIFRGLSGASRGFTV